MSSEYPVSSTEQLPPCPKSEFASSLHFPARYQVLGTDDPGRGGRQKRPPLRQTHRQSPALQFVALRRRPQSPYVHFAIAPCLLHHLVRQAPLLVDISLQHLRRQPRRQPPMLAAFKQYANNNVGIAPRRESDKPPVLRQIVTVLKPSPRGQRHNLR